MRLLCTRADTAHVHNNRKNKKYKILRTCTHVFCVSTAWWTNKFNKALSVDRITTITTSGLKYTMHNRRLPTGAPERQCRRHRPTTLPTTADRCRRTTAVSRVRVTYYVHAITHNESHLVPSVRHSVWRLGSFRSVWFVCRRARSRTFHPNNIRSTLCSFVVVTCRAPTRPPHLVFGVALPPPPRHPPHSVILSLR